MGGRASPCAEVWPGAVLRRLIGKPGVGGLARIVLRTMANQRLHPFGQATAQAATGLAFTVVARAAGTDGPVVQRLPRRHVVRDAEDKQTVVYQHDLQREARQFTASGQAAG